MSFSDNLLNWNQFKKRPEIEGVEILSPAAEVAAYLQQFYAEINSLAEQLEDAHNEVISRLAEQAVLVFHFQAVLERYEEQLRHISQPGGDIFRTLRVLKDQMMATLKDSGIEIVVPLGRSFQEVAEMADKVHWRHGEEYTSEIVVEVIEPIIKLNNRVVRPAHLVMGAPLKNNR
ncbi:MAG: nucleotide exchange factor GrpE [Methanobacteriota archaeon]|nr:MAG: nucleotide exchange factor GrpE [Euryarchaeota archaeon]